jgi:hypothetical protein
MRKKNTLGWKRRRIKVNIFLDVCNVNKSKSKVVIAFFTSKMDIGRGNNGFYHWYSKYNEVA